MSFFDEFSVFEHAYLVISSRSTLTKAMGYNMHATALHAPLPLSCLESQSLKRHADSCMIQGAQVLVPEMSERECLIQEESHME